MIGRSKLLAWLKLSVLAAALSGCAVQVQDDYGKYLANNEGSTKFVRVSDTTTYYLDQKTQNHNTQIRAFMTGIANSWTVRVGDILDTMMQSKDIRNAFGDVKKTF